MLFDAHRAHDMFPIITKLEAWMTIGGMLEVLRENVFLVNCQDELPPRVIEDPEVIPNGLQVGVVVEHARVLCAKIREEKLVVTIEEAARKAAPDAFAISELFMTIHEL